MKCKGCGSSWIENKTYQLCKFCNNERRHGNKFGKVTPYKEKEFKPFKTAKKKKRTKSISFSPKEKVKTLTMLQKDEIFYKECFDSVERHECEECLVSLPDRFKDDSGKILARFRYSHIIAKSVSRELRHCIDNINHLCLSCHSKWEDNNARKSMDIYEPNSKIKILKKYFDFIVGKSELNDTFDKNKK